jgi:hypothetical protein
MPSLPSGFSVNGNHFVWRAGSFFWFHGVQGLWSWHPAYPSCGADGSGIAADYHYFIPNDDCARLVASYAFNGMRYYLGWYPEVDDTAGGSKGYRNDYGQDITLNFHCNDWMDRNYYAGNRGVLKPQIKLVG